MGAEDDLRAENEELRAKMERLAARLEAVENPAELTLNALAAKLESMSAKMDEQAERLESRLDSLVGEGGARGPPASSLPLAETLGDLERLQMTEDQVGEAKDLFDLYDADASGTIDNDELMSVLRLLGEHPTSEEVDAMIAEVDENKNGDLTLNEFLTVYAVTVQKHVEEDCVDPSDPSSPRTRSETVKRKLNTVSFYGVHALMR